MATVAPRAEGGTGRQITAFFKESAVYGVGLGVSKFSSLLILPILTATLTPADLGVLTLLQVFGAVLAIFLNAGVQQAINRNYYDENTDEHRAAVVGTGLLWRLILTGVLAGGLALAALPMTRAVLGEATHLHVIYYLFTLANVAIMAPQGIAYTLYRVRRQAVRNTAFSVSGVTISFVMLVWLLWWRERGIRGALEAAVLATAAMTLAMLPDLLRSAKLRLRKDVLRGILSYGLPFLPHHLAVYLLFGADRYFLQYYRGATEVGLYSYGYRIAMIMTLVLDGASMAWTPFIFSIQHRQDAKEIHALTARYILALIVGTAAGLCLFAAELVRLLALHSPEYWKAASVTTWIIVGQVFLGVYQVFGAAVGIPKRTRLYPVFSGSGLVANLLLNWLLVPRYGMMGAAVATLISYAVMGLLALGITQRVYPLPYEWGRLFVLALAASVCVAAGSMIPQMGLWPTLLAKLGCLMLFPLILLTMGFLNERERARLRELVSQFRP